MMDMDSNHWIEGYLDDLRVRSFSAATISCRRYKLRFFWKWLADRRLRLDQLDAALVHEYLLLRSKELAPSTLAGNLDILRDFMRYALKRGAIAANPTVGVSCRWLDIPGGYPAYRGILKEIFGSKPAAVAKGHLPLFAPQWDSYLRHCRDVGYSRWYIVRMINCVSRFHEFVRRRGIRFRELCPNHMDEFIAQKGLLRSDFTRRLFKQRFFDNSRRSIGAFLHYAGLVQRVELRSKSPSRVMPATLLVSYSRFCQSHRGHRSSTINNYRKQLNEFGLFLDRRGLTDIRKLGVRDIDAFLSSISARMKPVSLRAFVSSLRSFFSYLYIEGVMSKDLARLVMSPVRFRRDRRPKYLSWRKIQQALESIDRTSLSGKRDYAILTLMACHGLRNGEVGRLLLADIDWNKGALLLRERKAGDTQEFPISRPTQEALRVYIAARPQRPHPQVFLTVAGPIRPVGVGAEAIVNHRLRRCLGGERTHYGAHLLRHSFAKALLDQGAKMTDLRDLLGHHSLESTHVYTAINTNELSEVADNYAGLLVPAGVA
jgi:site-specific recombinase XerD